MKYMPPTLISENLNEIKSFFKKHKSVVAKPINGFGGNNVILFKSFKAKKIIKIFLLEQKTRVLILLKWLELLF